MARLTKAEKAREKAIDDAFRMYSNGTQLPMMSIPKIFETIRALMTSGLDADTATKTVIDKYKLD